MSVEQLAAVTIGMTFNALTFVLGVLVGCSLKKRKDDRYDDGNEGA